jgi:CRISPR-associated endonuclease/helicase Cas3
MYRLLGWLKAIGASVIILSATLPDVTRRKLVESYSGSVLQEDSSEIPPYPRMTVSSTSDHTVVPLPANPDQARTIKLQWIDSDPQTQIQFLDEHLAEGGCAAVICNTVARAQEVYAAIKSSAIVSDGDCFLFHARFPYAWRKKTEETILERFSLQGTRPHKAIVVATQVIEQSLDLDFDLMISDLAPIDLLIQRAGRLHRHNRKRPSTLTSPLLALTQPGNTAKHDPDFGLSQYIYAPYILDRTWLTLRHLQSLSLPENTSSLIESVYGSEGIQGLSQDELGRLDSEKRKMLTEETQDISDARSRVILPSDDEGFFTGGTIGLEEDNPELHSSLQALTRADSPGITAICLHQLPDGTLVTDPQDRSTATSLEAEVTLDNLKKLLRSSIQINRIDLVNWLSRKGIPDTWKKSASLRHCRLLVFSNGACPIDGTPLVLYLTRELGLSFIKEVK